jgi:DNA-binding PadR family transcriptional regulator
MSPTEKTRNPAEYVVLGALALGPAHGYEIARRVRDGLGETWRLGRSSIYGILKSLEKEGLVRHERVDQDALPARKVFTLSSHADEVLSAWLLAPVPNIRDLRIEFLAKLHFVGVIRPGDKARLVADQLAVCRDRLNRLRELDRAPGTPSERRSVEFKIAVASAVVRWMESLLEGLDG